MASEVSHSANRELSAYTTRFAPVILSYAILELASQVTFGVGPRCTPC